MKFIFITLGILSISLGKWSDPLSSGSVQGYLSPSNVSSYFASLPSGGFTEDSMSKTSLSNDLNRYLRSAKTNSNSNTSTILITAGHTTTQPFAVTMALYLAGYLAEDSSDFTVFVRNYFEIFVVPMVNVDAYYNMTEENDTLKTFVKNFNDECG